MRGTILLPILLVAACSGPRQTAYLDRVDFQVDVVASAVNLIADQSPAAAAMIVGADHALGYLGPEPVPTAMSAGLHALPADLLVAMTGSPEAARQIDRELAAGARPSGIALRKLNARL